MNASESGRDVAPSDPPPSTGPTLPKPPPGWRSRRALALFGVTVLGCVGACAFGLNYWADKQFTAAERALEQRDFVEAKARLERCQSVRGDDPDDLLLGVRIARRSRANDGAEALLREFRQKFPGNPEIERETRLLRMQRGNPSDIEAALDGALARGDGADPAELEAALVGALVFLLPAVVQGDAVSGSPIRALIEKARRGADLWLRLRPAPPDQVEGLVWRGMIRAFSNDDAAAAADFRAALALDPEHRDARFQLAITLKQGSPDDAAAHLRVLLQRDPNSALFKLHLATICRGTGRPDEARELLDQILAAEPDHLYALIERGSLALDQGQLGPAEQWLSRAQHLSPKDPRANSALASCLRAAGRGAEAKVIQDNFQRLQTEKRNPAERPGPPKARNP